MATITRPLASLEHIDEGLADLGLAHGVAFAGDVGGFAQAAPARRRCPASAKLAKVSDLAVDGA